MTEETCTHDCGHVPEGYAITTCPYCQTTGIVKRPNPRPELGAIMCDGCGEWLTWDDEAGELGKPSPEHLAKLAGDEQARKVRRVWVERVNRPRQGTEYIENLFKVYWRESFVGPVPPLEDDDGFQMRSAFFSGILSITEMMGDPNIQQHEKAVFILRMREELQEFFDYADKRPPSDEAH